MSEIDFYISMIFANETQQISYTPERSRYNEPFNDRSINRAANLGNNNQTRYNVSVGKNETIVNEAIERGDIKQEDIPSEFLCIISSSIMTNPVYPKDNPNSKFDFEQIKKWIEIRKNDPCTRKPLKVEDLITDEKLAEKISNWLEEKCPKKQKSYKP